MKLPTDVSGEELVKVLQRVGFVVNRQKERHIIGDSWHILNAAGVTVERLLELR